MKNMYQITIILLLTLFLASPLSAQREQTRTVTATGSYVAGKYETQAEGQAKALFEAKKQALREAGATEDISSTAIIVLGGAGSDFREISSELSRIELEGRVRVREQMDGTPEFTADHLIKYSTTIRAEVVLEEAEEDLNFQFKAEGFKNTYLSGEKMLFSITPSEDCYLRIFFFGKTASSNTQIFPKEGIFKDAPLKAGHPVTFPPNEHRFIYDQPFEFTMEIEDEHATMEQGVLLIVALKKPYPFMKDVTYENVISWLSKIKRNEKRVLWQGIHIMEK